MVTGRYFSTLSFVAVLEVYETYERVDTPRQAVVFFRQRRFCGLTFSFFRSRETREVSLDHFYIVVGCHRVAFVLNGVGS